MLGGRGSILTGEVGRVALDQIKQHIDSQISSLQADIKDLRTAVVSNRRTSIIAQPLAESTPVAPRPSEQKFRDVARRISRLIPEHSTPAPPERTQSPAPVPEPIQPQYTGATLQPQMTGMLFRTREEIWFAAAAPHAQNIHERFGPGSGPALVA